MIRYLQGRPMTQAYLEWEVSQEEIDWGMRYALRRLAPKSRFTPLSSVVSRPCGRQRKPGHSDIRGLQLPDDAYSHRGTLPLDWLGQDPLTEPSYDPAQETRAKALITQELREMDAQW